MSECLCLSSQSMCGFLQPQAGFYHSWFDDVRIVATVPAGERQPGDILIWWNRYQQGALAIITHGEAHKLFSRAMESDAGELGYPMN